MTILLALALPVTASGAKRSAGGGAKASTTVNYGPEPDETATIYPAGPTPLLLLHGKGVAADSIRNQAKFLQSEGFTVFDLEWGEKSRGKGGIFPFASGQIEEAVAYVRGHGGRAYDPSQLVMVGGSRGALLAMLTAERENAVTHGTVKAVVALSGQVNPEASIERARQGELAPTMTGTLAETFGCTKELVSCPEAYVREWSPILDVTESTPPMLLAASEAEMRASVPDQYEMAEALHRVDVQASVLVPSSGHALGYWGEVREQVVAFLEANA
jgi:dipeptidyl aminopeptidase/acylaminoacyl peptidase